MNPNRAQSISNFPSNPQSARLFDQLESIYNSDARQNKHFSNQNKHLYARLIYQNQQRKQQKKSLQKDVTLFENQQIDTFWKNRQNELKERQRRKQQMINETRNANNNIYTQKVLSRSMVMPSSYELAHKNFYEDVAQHQSKRQQQKQHKTKFLSEAQMYNDFKHYQKYIEKQAIIQAEKKKSAENQQIEHKRLQQLDKWRKKHLESHNKEAFDVWDKARRSRANQQDSLQNYIVFQGARQLNQRASKMKNQVFERQHAKKDQYIRQLHSQLENNQFRTQNDSKFQKDYERRIIQERNQLLAQKDRLIKQVKQEHNKQHLQALKAQHRPRVLLPQKQAVQFPGLGSPVHIGKTLADDRRRQLEWLEKNLYRELSH